MKRGKTNKTLEDLYFEVVMVIGIPLQWSVTASLLFITAGLSGFKVIGYIYL